MREIRFRGKRIDNGKWLYGSLLKSWTGSKDIFSISEWPYDREVDPSTIGQYTGLKDNSGEEIYEGDIVNIWGGEHWQGAWEIYEKVTISDIRYDCDMLGMAEFTKVVGNIHDNHVGESHE